jgi:hypothetical protein
MERPILFSTPMVQAILNGRKTQTRRFVKETGKATGFKVAVMPDGSKHPFNINDEEEMLDYINCPYGNTGDILWVRETWCDPTSTGWPILYKADYPVHYDSCDTETNTGDIDITADEFKWKPSIHMPKDFCRIRLEITNIRVERLQNISERDAMAEGAELFNNYDGTYGGWGAPCLYAHAFELLWESLYGKDLWNANPWLWVIEFKKI